MSGRVALVTGAGRGIGRATALLLAGSGHRVCAVARNEAELAALAAEEPSIEVRSVSLADEAGCIEAIAAARELGPIAVLVNNAGIGSADDLPIQDEEPARWRASLAINLDAPFHLTRLASADMIAAGWGRVVTVSSTSGAFGSPACAAYTAAKHGAIGLMRAAACDLGPHGITCNAVLPGWVRTAMADTSAEREAEARSISVEEIWRERDAAYPRGQALDPDEIAQVIAFLCSDAASGVSGETVTVAAGTPW